MNLLKIAFVSTVCSLSSNAFPSEHGRHWKIPLEERYYFTSSGVDLRELDSPSVRDWVQLRSDRATQFIKSGPMKNIITARLGTYGGVTPSVARRSGSIFVANGSLKRYVDGTHDEILVEGSQQGPGLGI